MAEQRFKFNSCKKCGGQPLCSYTVSPNVWSTFRFRIACVLCGEVIFADSDGNFDQCYDNAAQKWNKNNINRPCTGKAYSFPLQSQLKI